MLIVVNRMVFLAGGIAHTSYGGIGLAVFLGLPIFLGASLFAVAAAILVAWLTLHQRERIDTFIGLIWAVGMAIGVVLVDLTPGYNVDLMSYLFGSILAVSYDPEYAGLRGINVLLIYTTILILSALTVVVAIKVVGLILVIALLTIPTTSPNVSADRWRE